MSHVSPVQSFGGASLSALGVSLLALGVSLLALGASRLELGASPRRGFRLADHDSRGKPYMIEAAGEFASENAEYIACAGPGR